MTCAILALLGLLLFARYVAALEGRLPLSGPAARRLEAHTADGWTLAVWHSPPEVRRFLEPVVLCHGLANNHAFFDVRPRSLVAHLTALGFDCYAVDLRGAGASRPPDEGPWSVTVDDHVLRDVPAVVALVTAEAGASQLLWVGHSLGGLVGLAASGGALAGHLKALVTIGSPAFFSRRRGLVWLLGLAQWLSPWGALGTGLVRLVAPLAGRVPAPPLGSANLGNMTPEVQRLAAANVFAPMWRGVLSQLADWIHHDAFRSLDGAVDYRAVVARLTAPVLVVGGSVDALAPLPATEALSELVPAGHRQLARFGVAFGHRADYGHGDLVLGRYADQEVFPVIDAFLSAAATPVAVAPAPEAPVAARP
jgi:pimeloyl-ACP methyl ester carboxylesterase